MTRNEFDILVYIEKNKDKRITQKELADWHSLSLGTVNKIIDKLITEKYLEPLKQSSYQITEKAYKFLEPYKVKRAIFFAAGFGSRMVPVTLNTPKPLIRVNGKQIIETLLDAVVEAEIEEIIIVRGYLKEQFDTLLKKYPNIKFVDNDIYNEANNISSALMVKDLFRQALILESDLLLADNNIIRKYEYETNYRSISVKETDDWCFEVKGNLITDVNIGGIDVKQMIGISYWDSKDGDRLSKDIEDVFNSPGGKERFWDEVALRDRKENYSINVFEIPSDSVVEIDTYKELSDIDPVYKIV